MTYVDALLSISNEASMKYILTLLMLLLTTSTYADRNFILSWECNPARTDTTSIDCLSDISLYTVYSDGESIWTGTALNAPLVIKDGDSPSYTVTAMDLFGLESAQSTTITINGIPLRAPINITYIYADNVIINQ